MAEMNWNERQDADIAEQPVAESSDTVAPAQPKKNAWWKWALLAISVLLVLTMIGCGLASCLGLAWFVDNAEVTTQEDSKYPNDNDLIVIEEDAFTPEELAYIDFVGAQVFELNHYLEAVQGRAQAWTESNFALGDDFGWLKDVSTDLDGVRAVAQRFIDYDQTTVPQRFRGAHTMYVLAMHDYLKAMDHLQGAIDGNNEDALTTYADFVSNATDTIMKAHVEFATARDGKAPEGLEEFLEDLEGFGQ